MNKLSCIVVTLIFFSSCNLFLNNKKNAIALNDAFVKINDSLYYKGKNYGELLGAAIREKNFSGTADFRKNLAAYVDNEIDYVKNMKDVAGSETFRQKEIEYLQFEKQLVTSYAVWDGFTATTSQDDIMKAYNDVISKVKTEEEMLNSVKQAQQEFGAKNGMPIIEHKPIQ